MRCKICGKVVGGKNKTHCWSKQHCGLCHYLGQRNIGRLQIQKDLESEV